jgi:hypothetical protein
MENCTTANFCCTLKSIFVIAGNSTNRRGWFLDRSLLLELYAEWLNDFRRERLKLINHLIIL